MNTGLPRVGFPSAGSWINYGLGTENQNLPGFVVMQNDGGTKGGPVNWSSGFLPAEYQGTPFRTSGTPLLDLDRLPHISSEEQRRMIEAARSFNELHAEKHPADV